MVFFAVFGTVIGDIDVTSLNIFIFTIQYRQSICKIIRHNGDTGKRDHVSEFCVGVPKKSSYIFRWNAGGVHSEYIQNLDTKVPTVSPTARDARLPGL